MIGHFVAVPVEFTVRYACESLADSFSYQHKPENDSEDKQNKEQQSKYLSVFGCVAVSKIAHEAVEFIVDQALVSVGVSATINFFGLAHNENNGFWPFITGAVMGGAAEIIFDQESIFANALLGFGVNLCGATVADSLMTKYFA